MDTITQFYPSKILIAEQIRSGQLPLWNPYVYSGVPLLANPQWAVFYPLNILFYLSPTPFMFTFLLIIHFCIAGIGTFLFVKKITGSYISAFLSGIIIEFSSYYISHIALIPHLYSSAYIPFILLFTEQYIEKQINFQDAGWRNSAPKLLVLGIIFSIQFLSGSPQISYYSLILAGLYYFIRTMQENKKLKFSILKYILNLILFCAVITVIIFSLSAIQLIPTLELNSMCVRTGKLPLETIRSSALNFSGLFKSFLGGTGFPEDTDTTNYFGFCSLLLIVIGIIFTRNRYFLTFIIISFFSLIYSSSQLSPLLYKVFPMYGKFHAPRRILILLTYSGAIMAGIGFVALKNYWLTNSHGRKYGRAVMLFSISAIIVSVIISLPRLLTAEAYIPKTTSIPYMYFCIILGCFSFLIFISTFLTWKTKPKHVSIIKTMLVLIILLLICDLLIFAKRLEVFFIHPDKYYSKSKAVQLLDKERKSFRMYSYDNKKNYSYDFRREEFSDYLFPNVSTLFHIGDIQGYDPMIPKRYAEYFSILNHGFITLYPSHFSLVRNPSSPLIDILNTRYAIGDIHWYHPFFTEFALTDNVKQIPMENIKSPAIKVEFTTILDNAFHIKNGQDVCDISIQSYDGRFLRTNLKAGQDTADWKIDAPGNDLCSHTKTRYKNKKIITKQLMNNAESVSFPTYDFYAQFDLPDKFVPKSITLKGKLKKARIAILDIRFFMRDRQKKYNLIKKDSHTPLYENKDALELITAVNTIIPSSTGTATLNILTSRPVDFSSEAIVEGWDHNITAFQSNEVKCSFEVKRFKSQYRISYNSTGDNFLILSIPYFKGWKAKIDNKITKIYPANHVLQGIFVPKGNHTIVLSYSPVSFLIGFIITTIGLFVMITVFVLRRYYFT